MVIMNKKNVVKILLYISMVVFLFIFLLFLIMDVSIFKPSYVRKKLEKDNYYQIVYENIEKDFNNRLSKINVSFDSLDLIINKDMIKEDVNDYIIGFYNNRSFVLHSVEIEANLDLYINKYLSDNRIEVESRDIVTNCIDSMISDYEREVTGSHYLKKVSSNFLSIRNFSSIFLIVTIILILSIYLILLFVYKVKPLGKVFMACSSLIILFEFYMQKKGLTIVISNDYLLKTYNNIYNDILLKMIIVGLSLFVGGVIFFFFEKLFDKNK